MKVKKLKQISPRQEAEIITSSDLLIRRVEMLLRRRKEKELAQQKQR